MAAQTTVLGTNGGAATPPVGARTVTSKDGTKIVVEISGQGQPLVVVWGALGAKDNAFAKPMHAELSKQFTVFAYDRRGRGGSGNTLPYTVHKEIEDLAAVCAATGTTPNVVGFSSGAALALLAASSGVKMNRVIAQEPPYHLPGSKTAPPSDLLARLRAHAAKDERDEAVTLFMRVVGVPALMIWVMRRFAFWKELRAVAHTLPYDIELMDGFEIPKDKFAQVRVPTLLIAGSKSPEALRDSAAVIAKTIPGAYLQTASKQNHGIKPKAIAPLIAAFVAKPIPSKPTVVATC